MLFSKRWYSRVPRSLVVFILVCICLGGVCVSAQKLQNEISLDSVEQQGQRDGNTIVGAPRIIPHGQHQESRAGQSLLAAERMPVIQELESEENGSQSTDYPSSEVDIQSFESLSSKGVEHGKPTKSTTTSLHQLPVCGQKKRSEDGKKQNVPSRLTVESSKQPVVEIESGKFAENSTLEEVDEEEEQVSDVLPRLKRPGDLGHQNSFSNARHFLVATLDGKVTLLNPGGQELWSIPTEELFSSTISNLKLSENGKGINLIPSLTGGIYKFDGESLVPMLMNADSLLKKSLKHSNDVVISGGKEMRTYGVDMKTGSLRYECGISGCVSSNKAELDVSVDNNEDRMNLVITQQLQTVRAIDTMTGAEKWNFSVGTHELKLARVDEGCYEGETTEGGVLDYVKVVIPDGRILGANSDNHTVWDKKFDSPIAQAWVIEDGRLIKVDPILNTPIIEEPPALYVGKHKQQFYVQESHATTAKLENALAGTSPTDGNLKSKPLAIGWKPSATSILDSKDETAITSLTSAGVFLKPFYVFDKDEITSSPPPMEEVSTSSTTEIPNTYGPLESHNTDLDELELKFEFEEDDGPIQIINQVIIASLWFWWKEVLGISLLTAVILNIILMKPIMRAVRLQTIRDMFRYFNHWKTQDQQDGMALVPIEQHEVVEYRFKEDTGPPRNRTVSNSSSHSQYVETPVQEFLLSSQYLRDFDPVQCLGKGGFGVVFEAKKKIDDRNYAVKRIALPNREKARVRVMREVKALAQLDHKNIVRYFNAWTEHPPNGWLEKNDPLWNVCIGSPSPTFEYPTNLMMSSNDAGNESSHYPTQRKRPDHSKISFPISPSEEDAPGDDSFIVFEAGSKSDSFSGGDFLRHNSDKSHVIPVNENDESTASSVSGTGFWKRPTSLNLNMPSSCDSSVISKNSKHQGALNDTCNDEDSNEIEVGEEACENESSRVMYLYIQQELCQKRTLQDWLRGESSRDLASVIRFFSQIVEAVEYVHSKKLIHRDLKPSNIFLAGNLVSPDQIVVKIGDFGLATTALAELEAEQKEANTNATEHTVKANLTGHVGTHLYMSPEQFQRKAYDYKVDIYSLGLIFFELLVPFSTEMERHEVLSRVRKLQFPSSFIRTFSDEHKLIQEMISHNPNIRPDATAINIWVQSHLQKIIPNTSDNNKCSMEMKTHRSKSSPAHMNGSEGYGLDRRLFPEESVIKSSPKRKFFKNYSTTTM